MTNTLPSSLDNPYAAIEKLGHNTNAAARVNTSVPSDTVVYLMRLHPRPRGVIKTTVNIIYAKLIHELQRRNITDQPTFIKFMHDCVIGLPGEQLGPSFRPISDSATPGAVSQAAEPPDGRGTPGDDTQAARTEGQQSPVQQPSQSKQARGGRSRKGVAEERNV